MGIYRPDNGFDSYEFDPERFLVPPTDSFIKRLLSARWGIVLVSGPDSVNLNEMLDFLANYSLRLSFYSEFSTQIGEFERLESDDRKIRTLDEILQEAESAKKSGEVIDSTEGVVRHVPRNPETIFVPEISSENVNEAVEAAIEGRLVVSGIRSDGSFTALQNFRKLVDSDHLAAASLMGILGTNVVKRICQHCKSRVEYDISPDDMIFVNTGEQRLSLYLGMGCDQCDGTGYSGYSLIHEELELSESIRTDLIENKPPRLIKLSAKRHGMQTLLDMAWNLANSGETTLDEVVRIAEITDPGKIE